MLEIEENIVYIIKTFDDASTSTYILMEKQGKTATNSYMKINVQSPDECYFCLFSSNWYILLLELLFFFLFLEKRHTCMYVDVNDASSVKGRKTCNTNN